MAATAYTYNLSVFACAAGSMDTAKFADLIRSSGITVAYSHTEANGDDYSFWFKAPLGSEDLIALDAIVATYDGSALDDEPEYAILAAPSGEPPTVAPTAEDTRGVHPQWGGDLHVATAGATNFYDTEITVEKKIRGGWYELMCDTAVVGDYIEFSMIDKNDVLGFFAAYGYTVGEDILELKKYVRRSYVNPFSKNMKVYEAKSWFTVCAGLFLRIAYVSTGTEDVTFESEIFLYD